MTGLRDYIRKRDFEQTPEPGETTGEARELNRFVIQRHLARREHYDFRLQAGDLLLSWAIPKEPVADPEIKRLAIKVEDHPLSYIHFEGTIPKGNYGAGTVMVWDLGHYYLDEQRRLPTAASVREKVEHGALKLYLVGVKLRGYFTLIRLKGHQEDQWLFMKSGDVEEGDFSEKSALTGRSMEEIAGTASPQQHESPPPAAPPSAARGRDPAAPKSEYPGFMPPMLATLADQPFSRREWLFELKLDGYRVLAGKNRDATELFSRRGNLVTGDYPSIAAELAALPADFVIDGEVCYMEGERADFQKMQSRDRDQSRLHYYVFDILWLNGHDLRQVPLLERKKLLGLLLAEGASHVHVLEYIEREGERLFEQIKEKRLEGMIAKLGAGAYSSGTRSKEWYKVKTGLRQEMIICGYTASDKPGRAFGALLCAVYEAGALVYTGRVGTGFDEETANRLMQAMSGLEVADLAMENAPTATDVRWLRPHLIAEVKFANWTREGIMRHASFVGLRSDKSVEQIRIEQSVKPLRSTSRVKLTNLTKVFWPEEGYTKEDVIAYYRDIAEILLPHLRNRPQSLYRTPDGLAGQGFFQKNVRDLAPDWVETVDIADSSGESTTYLLCQDEQTLLYMANLGCIEINPWSSSLPHLDNPDYLIFDLDPLEVEMRRLVELSLDFKNLFDQLGMPAYCKTSGSRGFHLYVPIQQDYTFEQARNCVKLIETHIHRRNPELTSLARSPSARRGRVYLDYLQNGRGKTMASVYSIRPRPGAPVSAPIEWSELDAGFDPRRFTLRTMRRRLERAGDPWRDIHDRRIDLQQVLAALG